MTAFSAADPHAVPVARTPLGTCTKFASPPGVVEVDADGVIADSEFERRLLRWRLQRRARQLLPKHRVRVCLRHRVPTDELGARIYRRADSGTYYGGLMTCGSVWACPICSGKISERRRAELRPALKTWRNQGGEVLMLTLTVPHTASMSALGLVDELLHQVKLFNSGKYALKTLVPGYVGQIRALEVTHGANGWHPHLHVLLILDRKLSEEEVKALQDRLYARWSARIRKAGLGRPNRHALSLQDGSAADAYVAKWGKDPRWSAAEEVTKQVSKRGRSGGRTPFALLEDSLSGDAQAGELFREFVQAFKGRQQFVWSPGLRDRLGLAVERTDEEEAAAVDALDELLARISDEDWANVRAHDLRGELLEVARTGDSFDIRLFLGRLRRNGRNLNEVDCGIDERQDYVSGTQELHSPCA